MPQIPDHIFKAPDQPVLHNVQTLFGEDKIYQVPKWQRDYSWDADEEVRLLLEDLSAFSTNPTQPNYVLGSFITYANPGEREHIVVDGQQRLVSLYILTIAIRDCLQKSIKKEYVDSAVIPRGLSNQLSSIQKIALRTSLDGTDSIPVILEFGDATQTLKALASGVSENLTLEQTSQINIYAAYEACVQYIDSEMNDSFAIAGFGRAVLSGTYLTESIVENVKQALEIFLKINIRGKKLEGSDYLKNYLFRNLDSSLEFDDLADTWEQMSNNLRSSNTKREKLKTPEFFLRNWALVLNGEKIGGDNAVFNFWETRFNNNPVFITEFLLAAPSESKNFSRIADNKLITINDNNSALEPSDFFKGTQYLPVLLAGAKLEEYEFLSNLVNYRYLFYILNQERTQDFESMIPKWAKKIGTLSNSASREEISSATKSVTEVLISPDQLEAFGQKILTYRYGKDTRKVRMILALIAKHYQKKASYDNLTLKQFLKGFRSGTGFDIDHILPQSKILGQRNLDADDLQNETNRVQNIFQSVGNLVLVNGLQRIYSDKDPLEKNDLYKQDQSIFTQALAEGNHSEDPMMSGIIQEIKTGTGVSLNIWNEDSVLSRSKFISEVVSRLIPDELIDLSN